MKKAYKLYEDSSSTLVAKQLANGWDISLVSKSVGDVIEKIFIKDSEVNMLYDIQHHQFNPNNIRNVKNDTKPI